MDNNVIILRNYKKRVKKVMSQVHDYLVYIFPIEPHFDEEIMPSFNTI